MVRRILDFALFWETQPLAQLSIITTSIGLGKASEGYVVAT